MDVNIFLFNDFETLDVFGPVEVLGKVEDYNLRYFSMEGGITTSSQGVKVLTEPYTDINSEGILLVPGGMGTRTLVNHEETINLIRDLAKNSIYCLSVCTGSALLAKGGVLDDKVATSNKRALDWVKTNGERVIWKDSARWCVDDKFYTASGVSAGIDMALGFVSDRFGVEKAEEIAHNIEYIWNSNPNEDKFSTQ